MGRKKNKVPGTFDSFDSVMTAGDHRLIVIDDFLKRESRGLEVDLFNLLSMITETGKKLIYLSTEMYQRAGRFEEKIKIDKFGLFHISDIKEITLR